MRHLILSFTYVEEKLAVVASFSCGRRSIHDAFSAELISILFKETCHTEAPSSA
jgi:hypothetical protein